MKHLSVLVICIFCSLSVHAELSLTEIRTASNKVMVARYKSDIIKADQVDTSDLSLWKLNGQSVAGVRGAVSSLSGRTVKV